MTNSLDINVKAIKHQQQEENKYLKKTGYAANTLKQWLESSELNSDLKNVLVTLKDNEDDLQQILNICYIVIKFSYKAVNNNFSEEWLQAIEKTFQSLDSLSSYLFQEQIPFTGLYIAKFTCLKSRNNRNEEAKECLEKAIKLSRNIEEKLEAYLTITQYYEDVSDYSKMKDSLEECENLSKSKLYYNYLAHARVLWGHYYFFQFNFRECRKNLIEAEVLLESILNQNQNKSKENTYNYRRLCDCLHYIGRTYFEEYEMVKAAEFYIKSQCLLENYQKENNLQKEALATAFYHLRLGQILENCQLLDSAKEHYLCSRDIFVKSKVSKSGLSLVNLALSNLIKHDSYIIKNKTQDSTLKKQEHQIKQVLNNSLETGYYRGYLLALLQLFLLYIKHLHIHLALPLIWKAITSDEFKKSGGLLLLYRYGKKVVFGIFYKIRFIIWLKLHSKKVLYKCPCPIHQNKQ